MMTMLIILVIMWIIPKGVRMLEKLTPDCPSVGVSCAGVSESCRTDSGACRNAVFGR